MKKLLFISFFCLAAVVCNAQKIYSTIIYYDKFDDVLKNEQRKTLITQTDTTFIIEEKGKKPVVYYILNEVEEGTAGSKDNVVNLVADVYGYQKAWCIVRYDLLKKYREDFREYAFGDRDEKSLEKLKHYWIFAISRIITTQYTGTYQDEMFWLQDDNNENKLGKDVNRVIYIR